MARLKQPFAFDLKDGVIALLHVDREGDAEGANVLRTIASAVQLRSPSGSSWSGPEYDSTGRYVAEYQQLSPGHFSKKKARYETLTVASVKLGLPTQIPAPQVLASSESIELDGNVLRRLASSEELSLTTMAQGTVVSKTELSLTRRSEGEGPAPSFALVDQRTRPLAVDQAYVGPRPKVGAFDADRMKGFTYELALRQIEALGKATPEFSTNADSETEREQRKEWIRQSQRAFDAMGAILRQQPQHVPNVVSRIEAGSPGTIKLLGTLADAGTPEAQAALMKVIGAKLPAQVVHTAMRELVRVEHPTPAAVAFVQQSIGHGVVGNLAVYGLGVMSRKLREAGEAPAADTAAQELVKQLNAAETDEQRALVLRGLSNTAYPGVLDAAQRYLHDPNRDVKSAAVGSLRLLDSPQVPPLLAEALRDSDKEVRLAALEALAERPPTSDLSGQLSTILLSDPVASARLSAVKIAKEWVAQADVRAALEKAASSDESSKVRAAAKEALQG
jgi:hypothetical protein